ncbi:hypothetical protein [Vibrio harveyi]|uniref:hypothetical protein n=1 Tax=Vibrio harveyi TaxID=669 RepID=UPI0025B048F6|nr:hypothetical protein [Vibrio harveyi]WJT09255.1 hypothetical protein PH545_24830 [Vibrio harveyi]
MFKKAENNHYELSENVKQGASIVININDLENAEADFQLMFYGLGNGKDDLPLKEEAINALGRGMFHEIKMLLKQMHKNAAEKLAFVNPELSEVLTGSPADEQGEEMPAFVKALLEMMMRNRAASGKCDCDRCQRLRAEMEAERKQDAGEQESCGCGENDACSDCKEPEPVDDNPEPESTK